MCFSQGPWDKGARICSYSILERIAWLYVTPSLSSLPCPFCYLSFFTSYLESIVKKMKKKKKTIKKKFSKYPEPQSTYFGVCVCVSLFIILTFGSRKMENSLDICLIHRCDGNRTYYFSYYISSERIRLFVGIIDFNQGDTKLFPFYGTVWTIA